MIYDTREEYRHDEERSPDWQRLKNHHFPAAGDPTGYRDEFE